MLYEVITMSKFGNIRNSMAITPKGDLIGTILKNGDIIDKNGKKVGYVDENGVAYNLKGDVIGIEDPTIDPEEYGDKDKVENYVPLGGGALGGGGAGSAYGSGGSSGGGFYGLGGSSGVDVKYETQGGFALSRLKTKELTGLLFKFLLDKKGRGCVITSYSIHYTKLYEAL